MAVDLKLARKAFRTGLWGQELGQKFGIRASLANELVSVGRRLVEMEEAALSPAELLVLTTLAAIHRENLQAGATRSPESRSVSARVGRRPGWCASTCRKRLFTRRYDPIKRQDVLGLGFVDLAGNGFVRLTAAGWAVVHAIEARP